MAEYIVVKEAEGTIKATKMTGGLTGFLLGIFILPFKGLWLHFLALFVLWVFLFVLEVFLKAFPPSGTRFAGSIFLTIFQAGVYWAPQFWGKTWLRNKSIKGGGEILGEFEAASKEQACEIALNKDSLPPKIPKTPSKFVRADTYERVEPK